MKVEVKVEQETKIEENVRKKRKKKCQTAAETERTVKIKKEYENGDFLKSTRKSSLKKKEAKLEDDEDYELPK